MFFYNNRNDNPTEKSMVALVEIFLQFIQLLPTSITKTFTNNVKKQLKKNLKIKSPYLIKLTLKKENPEMDLIIESTFNYVEKHDDLLFNFMKELANKEC
jgi:hypothetical protein